MSDEPLPAPETCAHNLHRVGDGRRPLPEPTDLCRNALGMFHMVDCPLTIGLACSYYEPAASPHPVLSDLDLEAAREELNARFLGWRYRRAVRWLTKPRNVVPVGIVVDAPPEPEEVVPASLAMRERPPEAVAGSAPPGAEPAADGAPSPAPAAPGRYPGQRRSEERLAKKRARLAALDAAAAAKAAQIAAVTENPPADDEFDEDDDEEFGAELADEEPEDTGPKTVEEVLAALPDAPLVGTEPRRQGPPRGGGAPRHRRRRGRRGRGSGGGQGVAQGGAQGDAPGQTPERRQEQGPERGAGPNQGQGPPRGPGPGGPRGGHRHRGRRGHRGPRGPREGGAPGAGAPSSSGN